MKKIQIKKMKEVKKLRKEVIEIEEQQRRNNILPVLNGKTNKTVDFA